MKVLGTHKQSSYPIIALSGSRIAIVSLQTNHPEIFRTAENAKIH